MGGAAPPAQQGERQQQPRDPRDPSPRREQALVDPSGPRAVAAGVTVGEVPGQLPALADAERRHRALVAGRDQRLDTGAAATARELFVLLAQPASRAEQRALDHRAGHAEPLTDLAVREPLELAKHEHAVVVLGEPAERPAEVVEPLL